MQTECIIVAFIISREDTKNVMYFKSLVTFLNLVVKLC